jgi:ComF family protein
MPFINGAPLDAEGVCPLCRRGLRGFDSSYCYGAYDGKLRKLIHLLKYDRMRPLAAHLGELMATALPPGEQVDAVVPVPLHWRRRWRRGFNQSELLARIVARRYGLKVSRALRRGRPTASQAGLTRSMRRANVAGAFFVRSRQEVEGRRILLVDDVMTTGATASACGTALKRAGARRVTVLTLARVDRRAGVERRAEPAAQGAAACQI